MSESVLERGFREGDITARLNIVRSLVRKNNEESIGLLIEAMGDTAWQVRKEAVATLASMDDQKGLVDRIVKRISANDNVGRRNAAVELFILLGKVCVPPLLEQLEDVNEDTQKVLIDVLGDIGDPSAIPFLITNILGESLRHDVSAHFADNLRSAALEALGKLHPSDEAVRKILPFLSDKENTLLVFSAIKAFEKIGSPLAVPYLIDLSKERVFQRAALVALGVIGDIQALDCFLAGFRAPSENIRNVAVKAILQCASRLADENKQKIRQAFQTVYNEQDYTFLRTLLANSSDAALIRGAICILGWVAEKRSVSMLIPLLYDYEDDVIFSLMAMGSPVLPELLKLSERGIWEQEKTRYAVAKVFEELPSVQGIPLLLDLLNDEMVSVREAAIRALGKTKSQDVIGPLLSMFKDPYPEVQEAARSSLLGLASDVPMDCVVHLLSESSTRLRANAALLLGEVRYSAAIPSVAFLIKDSDEAVRRAAICALGLFLPSEKVSKILLQALGDEDYKVRMAVLQALRRDRVAPILSDLIPLAYDENIWVRTELARTLASAPGEEGFRLLLQLSEDATGMVRIAALTSLGQRQEETIPSILYKHLNSPDRDVQKAAIMALGVFGDSAALPQVMPFLENPHWELRAAAVSAVGALKGALSKLKEISEWDEDPLVRDAACLALTRSTS